jgi:hypothetical protein
MKPSHSAAPFLSAQGIGWTPELMLAQIEGKRAEAGGSPTLAAPMHGNRGELVEVQVTASGVTRRFVREWGDVVAARAESKHASRPQPPTGNRQPATYGWAGPKRRLGRAPLNPNH